MCVVPESAELSVGYMCVLCMNQQNCLWDTCACVVYEPAELSVGYMCVLCLNQQNCLCCPASVLLYHRRDVPRESVC